MLFSFNCLDLRTLRRLFELRSGSSQAIPRFTTYAVCTICTEIYSTLVAALAVARLPCDLKARTGVSLANFDSPPAHGSKDLLYNLRTY